MLAAGVLALVCLVWGSVRGMMWAVALGGVCLCLVVGISAVAWLRAQMAQGRARVASAEGALIHALAERGASPAVCVRIVLQT